MASPVRYTGARHAPGAVWRPSNGRGAVRSSRRMCSKQDLPGTAQALEEPEDDADRVLDASVGGDDVRAHEAAELEEMMPVAPIAGEPRGLETEHGADSVELLWARHCSVPR